MRHLSRKLSVLFVAVGAAVLTAAHAAPYPTAATPIAIDLGPLAHDSSTISITVALRLKDIDQAESLLQALHTPGNAQFHKFLTADEFVARFAPSQADVAKVIANLATYGLTATATTATTLSVSGSAAALERAFSVILHSYEVPAHDNVAAYTFRAPTSKPAAPAAIASLVSAVVGFDNSPHLRPHTRSVGSPLSGTPSPMHATGDVPGAYTVLDFENFYDVNPLYRQGLSGEGSNIGIMTLANFTPTDVFDYWNALGLHVNPHRLSLFYIDGGSGPVSDDAGSLETTVDVEQSGGVAPGANIAVYMAPNTNQGFVDLFATAIDKNWADTLSVSWGEWEWFDNLENAPVTDPTSGQTVSSLQALHELLVRAAIQGQSVFTASGDGGAFEAFDDGLGPPQFNLPLSVDYPASDPAITGAGGTTLPGPQVLTLPSGKSITIEIPHERVWGWDWLAPYCDAEGTPNLETCEFMGGQIFSGGDGGGVSVFFQRPSYQFGLPGVQLSQPRQNFIELEANPFFNPSPSYPVFLFALPGFYPGRNVPDISFDADPFTGYVVYYTSSVTGFGLQTGWGGTSFVSPQLAGVTALLRQQQHGRIGLLNYPLYQVAQSGGYFGQRPALHPIIYGDNWFYQGSFGYNPAVGLGTLDVANFAEALQYLR